ncbi:hypothetical protein Syun_026475 [Stephania yunnanensis]|uniref:Uncharacterized protein n=1 Tax=Stephania yunnanensis TaxID=152371 RepID=A0AAP0ETN3_9MAGN
MERLRGRSNPEDEDVEDINRHPEETSTTGRGSLSHHATHAHPDGRNSLHYTNGWSHVTRPYPTYAPGPSSSHYTSSSPPGHPYPYQHGTPSPPVLALPAQHGFIPSSSHHCTPSPPADVYPHDHGTRPSSSHYATPSPSAHPAHSPGVGDEHTSTSRRPPAPHRHSSARSSSNRLRSSIPHVIEEIPAFSDLRQPLWKAKTLLFISLLSAELTRRLEEMSTQTPDTSIDEDAAYLEGEQAHLEDQCTDLMSWKSSAGPPKVARNIAEGANGKTRTNAKRQDGTPHVPPTPRTPPSPVTERSGPQSDDHPVYGSTYAASATTATARVIGCPIFLMVCALVTFDMGVA